MCGIIAYIGNDNPLPILLRGLHRLEYRGYDSAGIAYLNPSGDIAVFKKQGKVDELESLLDQSIHNPQPIGIGHTRWATHGGATDLNAHPHLSQNKRLAIVHNGIIENYDTLRCELSSHGYKL